MKISVVATRLEKDRILPRLANEFLGCNWIVSETPIETADLVYFFPYLEMARFLDWNKTPTACWYTHYEPDVKEKAKLWELTASKCDIRLTSAKMYYEELKRYGVTYLVTPPLERAKFEIISR